MDMNKDIATLPKKGLKTRPYNIGMEKMEKKDLEKLTKGQLIKLLLKKVSNHEDLLAPTHLRMKLHKSLQNASNHLHHLELENGKA